MGRTYSEVVTKHLVGARLAAVAGGSRAPQMADDYGADFHETWQELVGREDLDAVIIASPHHVHAEQAIAAARAGKHVMIEKPMATTLEQCDDILRACREHDVHCGVAFTQRRRVCNVEAMRLIEEGRLGALQTMQLVHVVPGGTGSVPGWQAAGENVGILIGHGIHCLDAVRWFSGREVESVYAVTQAYQPDYPVEATSHLMMRLEGGAVASLYCSFEVPPPGFEHTGYAIRFIFERGLVDMDAYDRVRLAESGGQWETLATQPPIDWQGKGFLDPVRLESYAAHLGDFLEAVGDGREPSPSGHDGRQAVAIALAAYESDRTRKEVAPR